MKRKVFSILALLLMAATGAMAQTTYTVSVKEGTEDADKWTADPNPAAAGQTVTVTYTGTKKVKSVKAVKKAPAGPTPNTLTAKLAYTGGEIADFTDATDDLTTMTWAVNEHIAILYEVGGTKKVADATITAVDGYGAATITFTVEAGTPDNTACTLVYPYDAAKDDHTGVKDAATLLAAQDGTLSANLDVRVGEGTIQTTTPGLTVTTQPEAQFAIFKFTLSGQSIDATHPLVIKKGVNDVVTTVTPASSATSVYVAMPPATSSTYRFIVTTDNNKYIKSGTAAITAGKYYQTTLDLSTARYPLALSSATVDDLGSVIASDGNIYLKNAATPSGNTAVAMIAYVGSETAEAANGFNHGLALALSDASDAIFGCKWSTSSTKVHTYNPTSSSFESESGLQYNSTQNSDTYPAFKAAITYSPAAPTGCSAWFLPSGYQWQKMINAAGGYTALHYGFSSVGGSNLSGYYYWSSTEGDSSNAWYLLFYDDYDGWYNDVKSYDLQVRACLAF